LKQKLLSEIIIPLSSKFPRLSLSYVTINRLRKEGERKKKRGIPLNLCSTRLFSDIFFQNLEHKVKKYVVLKVRKELSKFLGWRFNSSFVISRSRSAQEMWLCEYMLQGDGIYIYIQRKSNDMCDKIKKLRRRSTMKFQYGIQLQMHLHLV